MRLNVLFASLAFALCLTVVSCDTQKKEISGDFDRTGIPMEVTVVVYETKQDMIDAYESHAKVKLKQGGLLEGWSVWPKDEPADCTIHVVKPKRVDDDITMTWGHELVHCSYGNYH